MTVADLLKMDITVDVCDDYDERLYVAFVGPMALTEEGLREFGDVLPLEVSFVGPWDSMALVSVGNAEMAYKAYQMFTGLAGLCSVHDWNKWFEEV